MSSPAPPTGPLSGAVEYARRAREGLVSGLTDVRVGRLHAPDPPDHVRRALYGLGLPVTLLRAAWAHPPTRRSFVDRMVPPLLCIAACTALGTWRTVGELRETHESGHAAFELDLSDDDDDKDDGDDRADPRAAATRRAAIDAAKRARESGASALGAAGAAIDAARTQAESAEAEKKAHPPPPPRKLAPLRSGFAFVTSKLAALLAFLTVVEWILVWIGREHHDQIAFEVATLTGAPGEPLSAPPRLRLDLAWLKTKGWRALRLLLFVSLASPFAWLAGKIPVVGVALAIAIPSLWAAYWACAFALGNSHLAWQAAPGAVRPPWFVRALDRVARVPVLGWPVRPYAWLMTRATRGVWPTCLAFERAPWEAAGLALTRAVASLPVLYIVSRPLFTPAATHALLARMGGLQSPAPPEPVGHAR